MYSKINELRILSQGPIFKLVRENVTLPNEVTVDLDIIRHPGASAIVPILNDESVILIKQFRHAVGEYIWEVPAGTLNPKENPLDCAKRELVEETGYSAKTWQELGVITPVPAYSDERVHIYLATDLTPSKQNLDMDEILDVHEVSFNEAVDMIHRGVIGDSKTISSLLLTQSLKSKGLTLGN
jgi:ADP-ribose pyrophosphatase